MDLGESRPQIPVKARIQAPIVPRGSIAGRALVVVVAIMTYLASLTTGAVLLVYGAASEWQADVASEITVQVRSGPGRDLARDVAAAVALLKATPDVVEARALSPQDSAALLEPWLGSSLALDDLPIPRMIVVRLAPASTPDLAALRQRLAEAAPSATLDDHRAWIDRMRSMTGATVLAGVGILILVVIATIISVSFAARGAMAANRPIVEVLHFVGASDRYIAGRFMRHFLRLGLEGGVIGGGAAILTFGLSESIGGWFVGTPIGDQFAALLGTFSLRPAGYLALAAQALAIAAITALASRRTLFATLDDVD
jgi:cell division transport system permease protein